MQDQYICEELSIEITSLCHHKCRHCSTNGTQAEYQTNSELREHREKNSELTIGEIKDLMNQAKELGSSTVSFSGGEPLLVPEFGDLVKHAKELGLRVLIYTCCPESFSHRYIQFEDYLDTDDKVIFSMEGSEYTHDYTVDNPGHYMYMTMGIARAKSKGGFVEVHTCPTALNMDELLDMFRKCCCMGVKRVSYLRLVPQGRCVVNRYLMPSNLDFVLMQMILGYIQLLGDDGHDNITVRVGDPMNFLWLVMDGAKTSTCSAAKDRILIRPDGTAHFCAALKHAEEMNYGNIREMSLKDIWEKSPVISNLREFHSTCGRLSGGMEGACRLCLYFENCKGGCLSQRISMYKKHGGLQFLNEYRMKTAMFKGPDPLCPLQFLKKEYRVWENNDKSVTFLTHLLHEKYGYDERNIPNYWNEISVEKRLSASLIMI